MKTFRTRCVRRVLVPVMAAFAVLSCEALTGSRVSRMSLTVHGRLYWHDTGAPIANQSVWIRHELTPNCVDTPRGKSCSPHYETCKTLSNSGGAYRLSCRIKCWSGGAWEHMASISSGGIQDSTGVVIAQASADLHCTKEVQVIDFAYHYR